MQDYANEFQVSASSLALQPGIYHCCGCQKYFDSWAVRAEHTCINQAIPEDYLNDASGVAHEAAKASGTLDTAIDKLLDTVLTKHCTMTQPEYLKRFESILKDLLDTTTKKNSDYAEVSDAFANFSLIESVSNGRIKTADGIFVRMTDKVKRVAALLGRPAAVADESILDTLTDLAVYSIILRIYLEHAKSK